MPHSRHITKGETMEWQYDITEHDDGSQLVAQLNNVSRKMTPGWLASAWNTGRDAAPSDI